MSAASNPYKLLPGAGYRRDGNAVITVHRAISQLWLGPDHLLCAERSWWMEGYKRFDYRDIQAIIVRRTNKRRVTNLVISLLALASLAFALLSGPTGRWIWGTVVVSFGIVIAINWALGPTCTAHLQTAVQVEELPAWRRVRRANRGIAELRQRIIAAQGELPAAEVKTRFEALMNQPAEARAGQRANAGLGESIKPYKGRAHLILFWVMTVNGLILLLRIPWNSITMVILNVAAMMAAMGAVVWALIHQYETDLRAVLRQLTWAAAIVTGLELLEGYFSLIAMSVTHPQMATSQWAMWKHAAEANPLADGWALGVLLFFGVAKAGVGAAGLLMNPRPAVPPPLPLEPSPIPPPEGLGQNTLDPK